MKKMYLLCQRAGMVLVAAALLSGRANAATYTAAASGNFSSSITWGGVAPGILLSTDVVIIPSGITVILDQNETFSGTSTLTVDGTLQSGANNTALVMTSGVLSGNGTINVDSTSMGLVAGFGFTGSLTAQSFTSMTAIIATAANIMVTNNLYLAGGGALSVNAGSLTLSNNSNIMMNGGSIIVGGTGALMLTNTYNVYYTGSSLTSGLELSGSGLNNVNVNFPAGSLTLSSNMSLNGTLTLTAGNLMLNGYNLSLGSNSDFSASGTGAIYSTSGSNISIMSANALSGALRFSSGGNTVNNFTLDLGNNSNSVDLGSDINVNGMLTLTSGTLTLNSHNLSLMGNADIAASGTGNISSTNSSDISVTSANNFTGSLRFSATGNTVNNLNIDLSNSSNSINLGSDLNVNGMLMLTSGMLNVGSNDLTINTGGSINGGSSSSYVITGNGGSLVMNLMAGASDTFQVGNNHNYAPAIISANNGSANGNVGVTVNDSVYSQGTTGVNLSSNQPLVNATWYVTNTASTGINLNMQLMWSSNMELNSFNRNQAYISHYTGGSWDVTTSASATMMDNMYAMSRNNITSLSPFAVVGQGVNMTNVNNVAAVNNSLIIYPNPVSNTLYYHSSISPDKVEIYDAVGHLVRLQNMTGSNNSISVNDLPAGFYNICFYGQNFKTTQKFIKE